MVQWGHKKADRTGACWSGRRALRPEQGDFEPYAVPTLTGELRRHFRDHTWDVPVLRRVEELRNKIRFTRRDLMDQPARSEDEPSTGEIAQETGLTRAEVYDGMEALDSYRSPSLDAEPGASEDGFSLADCLGERGTGDDLVTGEERGTSHTHVSRLIVRGCALTRECARTGSAERRAA
ncbi:hypothetical protein IPZ68_20745 [Streptomyces arenae]|nr:hypothetical protein [Streptomyces arenae]